jgi:hypothetical protein
VSGFSDDGQWWWDGQEWIATSQVLIPDLPLSERAKELEPTVRRYQFLDHANLATGLAPGPLQSFSDPLILLWLILMRRGFRAYREWAIEQFKSAATYLLGPNEPILAAEAGLFTELVIGWVWGGYGVVVTAGHVLILANDSGLGHPRRVLLAAHPDQVVMRPHAGGILNAYPTILVSVGAQTWPIRGMNRIIKTEPVITAWWRLAHAVRA